MTIGKRTCFGTWVPSRPPTLSTYVMRFDKYRLEKVAPRSTEHTSPVSPVNIVNAEIAIDAFMVSLLRFRFNAEYLIVLGELLLAAAQYVGFLIATTCISPTDKKKSPHKTCIPRPSRKNTKN